MFLITLQFDQRQKKHNHQPKPTTKPMLTQKFLEGFQIDQWIILVLLKGGTDDITPWKAIHTWYIRGIHTWYIRGMYCQLGEYILPTTLYKNQNNPLNWYLPVSSPAKTNCRRGAKRSRSIAVLLPPETSKALMASWNKRGPPRTSKLNFQKSFEKSIFKVYENISGLQTNKTKQTVNSTVTDF